MAFRNGSSWILELTFLVRASRHTATSHSSRLIDSHVVTIINHSGDNSQLLSALQSNMSPVIALKWLTVIIVPRPTSDPACGHRRHPVIADQFEMR